MSYPLRLTMSDNKATVANRGPRLARAKRRNTRWSAGSFWYVVVGKRASIKVLVLVMVVVVMMIVMMLAVSGTIIFVAAPPQHSQELKGEGHWAQANLYQDAAWTSRASCILFCKDF